MLQLVADLNNDDNVDGILIQLPLPPQIDSPDVLFAFEHDGEPLPAEHGGPLRLVVPQLYAWKFFAATKSPSRARTPSS